MPIIEYVSTNHCNSARTQPTDFRFSQFDSPFFQLFGTKIQVCDVTRTPVRPQNVRGVIHQSSDADMNYRIPVYFSSTNHQTDPKLHGTALYTLNRSF